MEFISLFWRLEIASKFFKNLCTPRSRVSGDKHIISHDDLFWIAFGATELRG
jgi:hypothetical protein